MSKIIILQKMAKKKPLKELSIWEKRIHAIIIGSAIVLFWRGVWHLADIYLFPNNEVVSAVVSIIIAVGLLLVSKKVIEGLVG